MKKKILIISSSPRRNGNSHVLCQQFGKGASINHEVELLFLKDYHISYCSGCGSCNKGIACPLQDDMAPLLDKMVNADVIVFATPVYFYTMAGQMKTFIDRCCARYLEIKNKEFYLIATAAEDNKQIMERTIDEFHGFFDCLQNPTLKGVIYAHGVWNTGEVEHTPFMQQAFQMGEKC